MMPGEQRWADGLEQPPPAFPADDGAYDWMQQPRQWPGHARQIGRAEDQPVQPFEVTQRKLDRRRPTSGEPECDDPWQLEMVEQRHVGVGLVGRCGLLGHGRAEVAEA
jgi:hypothetical protein